MAKTVHATVRRTTEDAKRRGLVRIGVLESVFRAAGLPFEWIETATKSVPRRLAPAEYASAPALKRKVFFGRAVPYWRQPRVEGDLVVIPARQAWATPEHADAAHATANAGMKVAARARVMQRILHEPGFAEALDAVRRLGNPEALRTFLLHAGRKP